MKTSSDSPDKTGTPESPGTENLSADEKKALALKERAEHEIGSKRERLQKEAVRKTD